MKAGRHYAIGDVMYFYAENVSNARKNKVVVKSKENIAYIAQMIFDKYDGLRKRAILMANCFAEKGKLNFNMPPKYMKAFCSIANKHPVGKRSPQFGTDSWMTYNNQPLWDFGNYCPHDYGRPSMDVPELIRWAFQKVGHPDLEEVIEDVKAIVRDFPEVRLYKAEKLFSVVTEEITLEGFDIGAFEAFLGPDQDNFEPIICKADEDNPWGDDMDCDKGIHPHISECGNLCYGDGGYNKNRAREGARIYDYLTITNSVLKTYNGPDAYHQIEDVAAAISGIRFVYCEDCEARITDEEVCNHCSMYICSACSDTCSKCGVRLCGQGGADCYEEHMSDKHQMGFCFDCGTMRPYRSCVECGQDVCWKCRVKCKTCEETVCTGGDCRERHREKHKRSKNDKKRKSVSV